MAKQKKNAKARLKTQEKKYAKNFYAVDTETTGLKKNELVQFAAVKYMNGKEVSRIVKSIMPKGRFTD